MVRSMVPWMMQQTAPLMAMLMMLRLMQQPVSLTARLMVQPMHN